MIKKFLEKNSKFSLDWNIVLGDIVLPQENVSIITEPWMIYHSLRFQFCLTDWKIILKFDIEVDFNLEYKLSLAH